MHTRTKISVAALLALGGIASLAHAQATDDTQQLERVTVTGSAIKRIDAETAVPVTIFKMSDLKQQGVTTVEQILSTLTASQSSVGTNQSIGASTGGASFADLRGIGANKTLVLLNGRRIANNSFDGSAPDLNMIPIAALERVEVLRDSASSLYGTDAIGGVINFITRKDYVGGTASIGFDAPQHPGGKTRNANAGFGWGDLDRNGFNVFGFVDYQKQNNISGTQRPFNSRYPGGLSGSTSPANYYQATDVGNPAAPSCASGTFLIPAGDDLSCYMTTSNFVDYVPKSERISGMVKADVALGPNNTLSAEYFVTRDQVKTIIAGVPYGALIMNPYLPDGTTPNPYYPGNSGNSFTPSITLDPAFNGGKVGKTVTPGGAVIQPGYINLKWRDLPNGPRGDKNTNTQQRFVLALDGSASGWDYSVGATLNQNKVQENLISGYNNGPAIQEGILTGVINPFGDQSAAGQTVIDQASAYGNLMNSQGKTTTLDAHASHELGDWLHAGRAASIAIGAEYRHEDFWQRANSAYASTVVASTGVDPATDNEGKRNVEAVYTELNIPIVKNFDVTASVRFDKYSDFGNTTNPKLSFTYKPAKQVLLRGSISTGFRAPSVYELYAAQSYTNSGTVNDPVTCPNGTATGASINNCKAQFQVLFGGNTNLQPEKSKSANLGIIVQPTNDLNVGFDFWWLRLKNLIGAVGDDTLFDTANYSTFSPYFHRDSTGHLSTDGTLCPGSDCGYVDERSQNLGGANTNGIDITADFRIRSDVGTFRFGLNSTYVVRYEYQDYTNGPWNQNVGVYSGAGPVFRWTNTATAMWSKDQYTVGLTGHYKSGYLDVDGVTEVNPYATLDLYGSVRPMKGLALTLGVRNLTDRDPPLSYQTQVFQAGYDPRYTDPTGRTYYARASYDF